MTYTTTYTTYTTLITSLYPLQLMIHTNHKLLLRSLIVAIIVILIVIIKSYLPNFGVMRGIILSHQLIL